MIGRLVSLLVLAAVPAMALDLPVGAERVAADTEPFGRVALPDGPWQEGGASEIAREGRVSRRAYQLKATSQTSAQILAPLRAGLEAEGHEVLFECDTRACGGFDFRYGLDLLPEPEMHVNLGDFRYLLTRGPGEQGGLVAVVVSRGGSTGFVHFTEVSSGPATSLTVAPDRPDATGDPETTSGVSEPAGVADRLREEGHAILDDLVFATGSSQLEERAFGSLATLAGFLADNPGVTIYLVGHSDAEGSLEANVDLSRRRALAVVERLVDRHAIDRARIRAEGVGYLAPIAPNATPEGRTENRRVEVVLVTEP